MARSGGQGKRYNLLEGTAVDEDFCGLAGNDTIRPDNGDDGMDGGTGSDTISYSTARAGVSVHLLYADNPANPPDAHDPADGLDAGIGYDKPIVRMENIMGSGYGDSLYGDNGVNTISGGTGADSIKAYAGNDVINVRDGEVDIVDCGDGTDTANADAGDDLVGCENRNL